MIAENSQEDAILIFFVHFISKHDYVSYKHDSFGRTGHQEKKELSEIEF